MSEAITITRMFGPWDVDNFRSAVASKDVLVRDMGGFYADCIRASGQGVDVDWREMNALITDRWSRSALIRIKRAAWKEIRP